MGDDDVFDNQATIENGGDNPEKFDEGYIAQIQRMPKQTWPILFTELTERFSYYGIKAVLVLYLTKSLNYEYENGMAIYHVFSFLSFFTGIFGAILADSFVGNYKTIVGSLVIYSAAEAVTTITTIPSIGKNKAAGPLIGLFVTAIASGNIKPCVAAFGGEQFNQQDTSIIGKFFSLFYMAVNVGAMFSMIFVPMMRTDIQCYGDDCYSAVFGVTCVLIILSTVSIILCKPWVYQKKPEGNIMVRVVKIIKHAISQKRVNNRTEGGPTYKHWLYHAQDKYEKTEIEEVKALLKVLTMFIPLPVFWALFNQQGSSWTLQAYQMTGEMGSATWRADQCQFFNPILVLLFIPLFDTVVYPTLAKCNLELTPLKKMTGGMILAAISFAIAAVVQGQIQAVHPLPKLVNDKSSVDFINVSPCEMMDISPSSFFEKKVLYGEHSGYVIGQSGSIDFAFKGVNCFAKEDNIETTVKLNLTKGTYQTVFLDVNEENKSVTAKMLNHTFPPADVTQSNTRVRTIYTGRESVNLTYVNMDDKKKWAIRTNFSSYNGTVDTMQADKYQLKVHVNGTEIPVEGFESGYKFGTFGAYTVILTRKRGQKDFSTLQAQAHVDVESTSVHRIWQLPQYAVVSAGEVMFAVTGLEFAYSQAPTSMKSVLQSIWLVTAALGDLLVVILSVAKPVDGVDKQMILYGCVMVVISVIFAVMSYFYKYSDFSGKHAEPAHPEDEEVEVAGDITKSESTTHL